MTQVKNETKKKAAFDALVKQFEGVLYSHALRLAGGNTADADDLVQATWLRVWICFDNIRMENGDVSFSAYAKRVMSCLYIDDIRRIRRSLPQVSFTPVNAQILSTCDTYFTDAPSELLTSIQDYLRNKPDMYALFEYILEGLAAEQISAVLGISVPDVYSRKNYLRRKIKAFIQGNATQVSDIPFRGIKK